VKTLKIRSRPAAPDVYAPARNAISIARNATRRASQHADIETALPRLFSLKELDPPLDSA